MHSVTIFYKFYPTPTKHPHSNFIWENKQPNYPKKTRIKYSCLKQSIETREQSPRIIIKGISLAYPSCKGRGNMINNAFKITQKFHIPCSEIITILLSNAQKLSQISTLISFNSICNQNMNKFSG